MGWRGATCQVVLKAHSPSTVAEVGRNAVLRWVPVMEARRDQPDAGERQPEGGRERERERGREEERRRGSWAGPHGQGVRKAQSERGGEGQ